MKINSEEKKDGTVIQVDSEIYAVSSKIDEIEQIKGVHGTSRGKKITDGKVTDVNAIRVWVEKKKDKNKLTKKERIPEQINGVPTDVIELGEVWATGRMPKIQTKSQSITEKYRPVPGGTSICESTGTAGTMMVPGKRRGVKSALTNTHVACKSMRKDLKDQRPLYILQPAPYDGGQYIGDKIGDTTSAVIVPEGYTAFNDVAAFDNLDAWTPEMHQLFKDYTGGYNMAVGVGIMEVGDMVFKVGRTTELTEMQVVDLDAPANVNYGGSDGVIPHKACIVFTAGSAGGDSGSAIFKMVNGVPLLVAYLFAGSSQYTIGHEIQNALSIMDFLPAWHTSVPQPPSNELEVNFMLEEDTVSEKYRVYGVVKKTNGDPINQATISLGSTLTMTNESGAYEFRDVDAGEYDITASADGFKSVTKKVLFGSGEKKSLLKRLFGGKKK